MKEFRNFVKVLKIILELQKKDKLFKKKAKKNY
jgi:hypothetical protein